MRLVLLTGVGLEHRYVARALDEAFGESLVAIVRAGPTALRVRVRAWWRRYSVAQVVSRVRARLYRKRHRLDERRARTLTRVLFDGQAPAALPRPAIQHLVPGHNHEDCLALLRGLAPDVIVVYGTGIIRDGVLSVPSRGTVNLHTGLSPWYRGADTIFWPIHNEEPERIGVTVHLVSASVDAGAVLATGRPALDATDDEDSLFAKGVRLGSDLLVRSVHQVAQGAARATPQALELGREYRFIDRTVAAERRVAALVRDGLLARAASGAAR